MEQVAEFDCPSPDRREIARLQARIDELERDRAAVALNASEAVYGVLGWLTARAESVTLGASHNAGVAAELASEFCTVNGLEPIRDHVWPANLKHPPDAAAPAEPTPTPRWMYSSTEEEWSNGSECDSRDEAIAEALHELDLAPGERFWTGITDEIDTAELADCGSWGSMVTDQIGNYLYDEVGDHVEFSDVKAELEAELETEISGVIARWLARHRLTPKCWRIQRTASHVVATCGCANADGDAAVDCKVCDRSGLVIEPEDDAAEHLAEARAVTP